MSHDPNHDHAVGSSDGGSATGVLEGPSRRVAPPVRKPRHLPPYRVLLHNDPVNTFEHVILSIVDLTTISTKQAIERTVEAHESGISLLLVTHQERAELYQEQFLSVKITVTIEPMEE